MAGFFEDLGRKVGSTIRGILDGTTSLKDGLKGLVSDIGQMIQGRLIDSAVNGLFGLLPDNVQQFLGVGGGGSPGRYINGGGFGGAIGRGTGGGGGGGAGGLFSTGTIAKLGKEIGTAMGNGSGLWKGIATGVKNALTGVSSTAAGNLGFKGPVSRTTARPLERRRRAARRPVRRDSAVRPGWAAPSWRSPLSVLGFRRSPR
ncbi:MAG: hypothetical protein M5U09_18975 [Gammaproteobacteria bacterium]|nr:hypothetical protein [Gammaproteobacteria bacterium]